MSVSKNRGTPKWMVLGVPQNGWVIRIDDLGVPLFLETPTYRFRVGKDILSTK